MSRSGTDLSHQKLEYDEVIWAKESSYGNQRARDAALQNPFSNSASTRRRLQPLESLDTVKTITTAPVGLESGMATEKSRPPYWVFSYQIDPNKGLVVTNVNVKDTVSAGSVEEVFEKIEFSDLKLFFNDGKSINFDLPAALAASSPDTFVWFTVAEDGEGINFSGSHSAPRDTLYQRGIKLEIVTNILASSGGRCFVSLAFSIVFRGSNNDFDPGGVPVALIAWPQFSFRWSNNKATKRVVKFIGSIKISMRNKMHSSHMHHGTPRNENIVGLYTDSNTSMRDSSILAFSLSRPTATDRASYYSGLRADAAAFFRQPFAWAMLFDYINKLNLHYNSSTQRVNQSEYEITAVYGPDDGTQYRSNREKRYEWIPGFSSPGIRVKKSPRQGMYDNMHNHARMSRLDSKGNVQLHAPSCGHSCIHTHWRWSNIASWGFIWDTHKYKGWGRTGAFSEHDAPKVPPNQKVKVALCRPNANSSNNGNSFSDSNILNPATLGDLDPLRKMYWYRCEIIRPNANEEQVAMEQGLGWAFRYSTPSESFAVDGLTDVISDSLPWTGTPTQHQMSAFFEDDVYPIFRYVGSQDQVPEGTHNILYSGGPSTSMEDL